MNIYSETLKYRNPLRGFSTLLLILSIAILSGCNMVKYVPDDRFLLDKNTINIDNKDINKEELKTYLRQEENLKILGITKFHLWVYNLSSKKKESSWIKEIGEPPVIFDEGLKDKTSRQLLQYMRNKGYYRAIVSDSVAYKGKKASVEYSIVSDKPYIINELKYTINDNTIKGPIMETISESLVKVGDILDLDLLNKERKRIALYMQNSGYYKFVEEYIHFSIDTTMHQYVAKVDMIVENAKYKQAESTNASHKKYGIGTYLIYIDKHNIGALDSPTQAFSDSTVTGGFVFRHNGRIPIRSGLLVKSIALKPGSLYSEKLVEKTYNNLYSLRQFKYVNIQLYENENPLNDELGRLDGKIIIPMQVRQNYSTDIEATNTSGNLGIAGNIYYQHKNLFRGAEIFDLSFKGATERQEAVINETKGIFNTIEYGVTAKLSVPGFMSPIRIRLFEKSSMLYTSLSLAYNYQERPDYTRTILNSTLGYSWRKKETYNYNLNVFDINAVDIFRLNPTFLDRIKDLYIKSSYTDHITSATNFSINNNNAVKDQKTGYNWRSTIEVAGNTLWIASTLLGSEKHAAENENDLDQSRFYKVFDTRFAQYIKGDIDYKFGHRFDKFNSFAMRTFFGLAYPYGNFHVIPFEKRYFSGGANGIRAWQVRSLGPGSYLAAEGEYPNQSADIKLEASIEYRFKLFWMLEGACFLDAGNIWAINQNDNRQGALFQFDKFYNDIAVGTGLGLRLVYTYFIIRADLGLKLRDPSQVAGQNWIPLVRPFNQNDLGFNIAIGYPF